MSSVEHYENFPVASWLCPARLRPAIVALYHFARTADDLADEGDTWSLTCAPTDLAGVRAALEEAGIAFESADSTMVANLSVALETAEAAQAVLRLIDALEDNDDIQDVYSNFDIADELMQNLEL
jgi:transcriptional/translational regulatory protein YebC/TACO1